MIFHVLNASKLLKPKTISIVISNELIKYKNVIKKNSKNIKFAIQSKQLGTADAVRCALNEKPSINSDISLILYGDTPLISHISLKKCLERFKKRNSICVFYL